MARWFQLVDVTSVEDVRTYLTRARTINDDAAVRFQGVGGALGIWTCVLTRVGLLDRTPTVLGLRTAGLGEPSTLDAVVNVGSVLDRMPRFQGAQDAVLRLPPHDDQASWAGISPSLSGWQLVGVIAAQDLIGTAKTGTEEVAQTVPTDSGREMVQRVRSAVWSRVSDWGHIRDHDGNDLCTVPDGAAFAAWALGFLRSDDDSQVAVAVNGSWTRLSCPGGFVLIRS